MDEQLNVVPDRSGSALAAAGLRGDRTDLIAALARGAAAGIPWVGGLVAEVVNSVIPNQKLDRVVAFVGLLADEADRLNRRQAELEARVQSSAGSDLLEEGIVQASRAVTEKRRRRIAHATIVGLTEPNVDYDRARKLLSVLNELTDSEVILLHYYAETPTIGSPRHRALQNRYPELLRPVSRSTGASASEVERGAFRDSYERTLIRLGLLQQQQHGLSITPLGQLFLKYIGEDDKGSAEEDAS